MADEVATPTPETPPESPEVTPLVTSTPEENEAPNLTLGLADPNKEEGNEPPQETAPGEVKKEGDTPPEDGATIPPKEEPPAVRPAATLEDPGEFVPNDYSFEITTFDSEGRNPKTTTIHSPQDWERLIDQEPNFGGVSAFSKAQAKATRMQLSLERDEREHKAKQEAYEAEKKTTEEMEASAESIINGILYLEERGDLPKVPDQFRDDWDSPEAKENEAVKEQMKFLSYMRDENDRRLRAGLPIFSSVIDAHNAYQLDQIREDQKATRARQNQARRTVASRVGSQSPAPASASPPGMIVGRGGSLDDL